MKSFDYKSIALPAELQGHLFTFELFTLKDQLNQCIKKMLNLIALLSHKSLIKFLGIVIVHLRN